MSVPATPSWDAERTGAPKRPAFASGLPPEQLIPRPRRLLVAFALTLVVLIAWAAIAAFGALDLDTLRTSLVDSLPDDLRAEYEADQQERAATIMLAVVGGLGIVAAIAQVLAMRAIAFGRSALTRVGLAVCTAAQVPVTLLAWLLRGESPTSAAETAVVLACSLVALLLVVTPRASRWLRQGEAPRSIPIAPAAP